MTEQRHRIIEITCKLQKISLHSSPLGLQMGEGEGGGGGGGGVRLKAGLSH